MLESCARSLCMWVCIHISLSYSLWLGLLHQQNTRNPWQKYTTTHTHCTPFSHRIIEKLETKWMRYNWIDAWRLCHTVVFMCEKSKMRWMGAKKRDNVEEMKSENVRERESECKSREWLLYVSICVSFPFCVAGHGSPCTTPHLYIYPPFEYNRN